MSHATFDPFDLPSSFDPLGREGPPPPRVRRVDASARTAGAGAAAPGAGAGGRLAHLLKPTTQAAAAGTAGTPQPDETPARLLALEDEVAILTARLDGLQATMTARLEEQQLRIVRAVATLLDARLVRRG